MNKRNLSVYLFIRNSGGQIKKTETKEIDSNVNDLIYYDITLHLTDKLSIQVSLDPYPSNGERILSIWIVLSFFKIVFKI